MSTSQIIEHVAGQRRHLPPCATAQAFAQVEQEELAVTHEGLVTALAAQHDLYAIAARRFDLVIELV